MFTINLDPMLVHLGPLMISWYGLAVALAILVGSEVLVREASRRGIPTEGLGSLMLWSVLGGIVGARLFHVLDAWDTYAATPMRIFALQKGGLAILGALFGGTLTAMTLAWRRGLPVRRLADAAAPAVILGQAIGRLGCLVTGDALGRPTDGTWGIVYQHPNAMAPQLGVAYQPVFFYELVWNLLVFGVLWRLRPRVRPDGMLFGLYLALYATGKFIISFFRTEAIWFWGLQEAHVLSVLALLIALGWMLWPRYAPRWRMQTAHQG